ncbi:MAG: T9SS type A sorting domain-containing protein [Bacteroidales bacterium]|jgi:hypothetical protein|nr:T9SS type A sorting domain-containing protein [Bacteroidales bacterium]
MKKKILLLLLLFICNLTTVSIFAQIRYVKPDGTGNGSSWDNASGNIQDMIDYTFSGGQVWIAAGTYNLSVTVQMKDGVNVYGGFFGDETSIEARQKSDLDDNGTVEPWEFTHATVLSGQNAIQVLNQSADFSVETVWDGVSIINGKNTTSSGCGGGAYIRANCILINSDIRNNTVARSSGSPTYLYSHGGGIYNLRGTISNCIIRNNTSSSYSNDVSDISITAHGGGVSNIEGTVIDCVIRDNRAFSGGNNSNFISSRGGGIYNSGTISTCTISNNTTSINESSNLNSESRGVGICNENESSIVNNCVISNNNSTSETTHYTSKGGGIYGGTIDNCTVINNIATNGGGIYGSVNISNCTVEGNSSTSGGGIYNSNNNITISNCIVNENLSIYSGGGIYCSGNYVSITNCIISENVLTSLSPAFGGGIYCSGSGVTISNCTINGNTVSSTTSSSSHGGGGGVAFINTSAKITDCIIKGNKTLKNNTQDGFGGGVYRGVITRCRIEDNISGEGGGFYGSSTYNCIIFNNSAATNGGGGYLDTNGKSINCTFVDNTAGRGGGIYFNTNTGTCATNCIFWQNYASMWEQVGTPAGANEANVTYSAIQEVYPGIGNIIITEENENGGPLFLNPLTQNWQLQEDSPCINAGNNDLLPVADTTDLAENPRIFNGTVDMGAYERQDANPPTYTISGQVTYDENPLTGATITNSPSVVTDESGEYSITVYQGANITITPAMDGYGFMPISITYNNVSRNLENNDFTAISMIPVTNIINISDTIFPSVPYMLVGTVLPSNATNQTIIWNIFDAGTTGATITNNTLTTTAEGTLVIRATILNGITLGVNYVQYFTITSSLYFFCDGIGTLTDPYQICTHQQLNALAIYISAGNGNTTSGKYYKLMNDIDFSSYDNWTSIGNNSVNNNTHRFQGNFDGNEKVVKNLTINTSKNYQGLFGYVTDGSIHNLGIENCSINGNKYVGGLLGYSSTTTISNCYTTGNVSGNNDYVGGLVGYSTSPISDCYSTANVSGYMYVGGLTGFNSSTLSNSYATGKVNAINNYVGGLVGRNSSGTIRNCIAANDSIISASYSYNINRVCGNNSGTYQKNYALNTMVVKGNNTIITITNNTSTSGSGESLTTFKSTSFYTTLSNWSSTSPWNIVNPSGIWKICNGWGFPFLRWQDLICDDFISVTDITDVPSAVTAGTQLSLTSTVLPNNATNQTIIWSIQSAGGTGATITENTLNTITSGTISIIATIINGTAVDINYTKNFTIFVSKAHQTAPEPPTLSSNTTTRITLNEVSDCEYNINGGNWQSSPIFEGLTPSTAYTFTQRKKGTPTHWASPASTSATFSTSNTTLSLYTIIASVNDSAFGTITPYGETQVEEGSDITFNITSYNGYVIDSVLVNDTFQGEIATYTFTNVQTNGSIVVIFKESLGVSETMLSDISIYPNPTRGELRVTSDKIQVTNIEFFDVIGKKLFTPLVLDPSYEIVINISHLQEGVYFVKISTKDGKIIKKVLKE